MAEETQSSQGPVFTRRRLLGAGAAAGGAALGLMPPNVQKALASPPSGRRPSLNDIEHVVLLMQENRSFDHYFGTMSGVRGFSDPNAIRLPTGRSVFYQPTDKNPDGYVLPFHLDSRTTSAQGMPTAGDYAWDPSHMAWNGGKMDQWLPASYRYIQGDKSRIPLLMGYFDEQDIPFHRALADAFTICDNYFCSVLGSTTPNRLMWETGTIDPNGTAGGPVLINRMNINTWRTYAENLTDAGVSWKFYWEEGGMKSQAYPYFQAYRDAPTTSPLYENTRVPSAPGQFEYDALNDRLPTVSWLFPPAGQNEHPNQSMPAAGAQYIASKIDAIAANPDVWAKTVFILVWDENGGMFDHVPPPTPPAGTPDEFVTATSPGGVNGGGLPVGAGFRVGCIIVSPWTAGGWVCSEPFDHTSNLRLLERVTGVECPNISAWRRTTFGDLTSAFRFRGRPAHPPTMPSTAGNLALAQYEVANLPAPVPPSERQVPPVQAPGRRPVVPPRHDR
ncbi:alkaline phosphatase family protein [Plantactinospora sp. KLBMP9567]|uniref:alkaline phosphatase family protein n=1 Tax=Plantactinospora sp. KLBMP9567 TaxID=3085900 RepID=UPI0029815FFB|nr:alkaline phosphatase family protein [Plantactinospora sp. KLBMP9567]MDW5325640.1 alkaline phosphatase family protein [Plantactinospora sp. KLBMP9567]